MGSWNISCALSNLSIKAGDKCYFLPLVPTFYHSNKYVELGPCTQIGSNEGSRTLFEPAFFPILGKYNDYGGLENIVKDKNTEVIEKVIGINIDKLTESFRENSPKITREEFIYNLEDPKVSKFQDVSLELSGCFIHEFAYKEAIKYILSSEFSFQNSFPVGNKLLEYCGLGNPIKDENNEERYNYLYRINGIEKYAIKSDGTYSHIAEMVDNKWKDIGLIHNLLQLKKDWKRLTGHEIIIPKEAKRKSSFEMEFYNLIEHFKKSKRVGYFCDVERNKYALNYKEEIIQDDPLIRKSYCELRALVIYFHLNCKMLMPALNGTQDGCREAEQSLLKASLKYVEKEIKWQKSLG